jgi:hypothetical protein
VGIRFSKSLPEAFIASASPSYCLWGKCVNKKFSSEGNYFWRGFPDIYFSGGQILSLPRGLSGLRGLPASEAAPMLRESNLLSWDSLLT